MHEIEITVACDQSVPDACYPLVHGHGASIRRSDYASLQRADPIIAGGARSDRTEEK